MVIRLPITGVIKSFVRGMERHEEEVIEDQAQYV